MSEERSREEEIADFDNEIARARDWVASLRRRHTNFVRVGSAGAYDAVGNLRARDLPNHDLADALVRGEFVLFGIDDSYGGHHPAHVGECDQCGWVTTLHDIEDNPPGRLGSCVGYHCAACCDRATCDARVKREVHVQFGESSDLYTRVAVKRDAPPLTIPLRSRESCLACRGGVECLTDHGCEVCGHTMAYCVHNWCSECDRHAPHFDGPDRDKYAPCSRPWDAS